MACLLSRLRFFTQTYISAAVCTNCVDLIVFPENQCSYFVEVCAGFSWKVVLNCSICFYNVALFLGNKDCFSGFRYTYN